MKKIALMMILSAFAISMSMNAQTKAAKYEKLDLKMYPKAKDGYRMVYIQVPVKANENDYKVEVFVGKNELVDCNKHFMTGSVKEENLDGWGYNYYTVESKGVSGSTLMACPDNKKVNKFIYMEPQLMRYNSKLPIVLYIPTDMDVKYRIWTAGKSLQLAKKGVATSAPTTTVATKGNQIEDKRWKLIELNGKAVDSTDKMAYVIFHSKGGKLEAKANCNMLRYTYTISNGFRLKISEGGISTKMACPDQLEDNFIKMLSGVDNFTTDGNYLSLNKGRMAPLARFELVK